MTFARGAKVKDDGPEFETGRIRELTGVLLPHQRKRDEHEPDYFGSICIDGHEYQLRAWNREGAKGAPFIKIKCGPGGT